MPIHNLEELDFIKRVKRRSKGVIASNAYDLTPLVEMLAEVAKMYPNDFPRRIKTASYASTPLGV